MKSEGLAEQRFSQHRLRLINAGKAFCDPYIQSLTAMVPLVTSHDLPLDEGLQEDVGPIEFTSLVLPTSETQYPDTDEEEEEDEAQPPAQVSGFESRNYLAPLTVSPAPEGCLKRGRKSSIVAIAILFKLLIMPSSIQSTIPLQTAGQ